MTRSCSSCVLAVAVVVLGVSTMFSVPGTAAAPPETDSQSESSSAKPSVAQPQEEIATLEPGKPIERELGGGQKHRYQIALSVGQLASIVVEHQGIDLTSRWLQGHFRTGKSECLYY